MRDAMRLLDEHKSKLKLFRPHSIFRNGATLDFSGGNYDLI
jgi:hypothetical protein